MSQKVVVDQNSCIGCNSCVLIDPDTFTLDQSDYKSKVIRQPDPITDITITAKDSCPVGAISIIDSQ